MVYGAGNGEVMWPGPEIIVMIGLGRKNLVHAVRVAGSSGGG